MFDCATLCRQCFYLQGDLAVSNIRLVVSSEALRWKHHMHQCFPAALNQSYLFTTNYSTPVFPSAAPCMQMSDIRLPHVTLVLPVNKKTSHFHTSERVICKITASCEKWSADVTSNMMHIIIKRPIKALFCPSKLFLLFTEALFFGPSFVCSQRRMWKILSLRQAANPPNFLSARSSFAYHFLSLSLSSSLSVSRWKLCCFSCSSSCHPAGLWTEIGEGQKKMREKEKGKTLTVQTLSKFSFLKC